MSRPPFRQGRGGPALVERIVSGGQTGVDRAALDAALELAIPCGGWCPRGRTAEDGVIAERYPLRETPEEGYGQRTAWNVRDADGTLVLTSGAPAGGTAQTIALAIAQGKPHLVVDLDRRPVAAAVQAWLRRHGIAVLNVAGPRESKSPGVYAKASRFLRRFLTAAAASRCMR
jgi:hypothetical protein